jgi:transposase
MPRFKDVNYEQGQFIPVRFSAQILPGSFEYALSYIVDHKLDLSVFDSRYANEEAGAQAYDPRVLLRIVLYAYSRGILSSRDTDAGQESFTRKMIKKIDSLKGRYLYSRRMGVVEPVFSRLCQALGLDRFTLRGRTKVNIQWKLFGGGTSQPA